MTAQSAELGRATAGPPQSRIGAKRKWLIGYVFISPWLVSFRHVRR